MQQKHSIVYNRRQEKLKNILNNNHLFEMVNQYNDKKRIFNKYRSKVVEIDKRRKDLLSKYVNKKDATQKVVDERQILHKWNSQTNKIMENEFCDLDCRCLKSNGKWCGCF